MLELSDYPDTGQVRVYDIEAISLPIVYNKFGDHDPNGLMYVLKQDSKAYSAKSKRIVRSAYASTLRGGTTTGHSGKCGRHGANQF